VTVREAFEKENMDQHFIPDVMDDGRDYWQSAYAFIIQNWEREIETMSPKQVKWFNEILDDCVEKRIEG
jgi:hypothetical protein